MQSVDDTPATPPVVGEGVQVVVETAVVEEDEAGVAKGLLPKRLTWEAGGPADG